MAKLLIILVGLLILAIAALRGRRVGLWMGVLIPLLLVPYWAEVYAGALRVDARIVGALVGCLGLGRARALRRVLASDVLILAIVATMTITQILAGEFRYMTDPCYMAEWVLPYVVGRFFLEHSDELDRVIAYISIMSLPFLLAMIPEALTGVNIPAKLFGGDLGYIAATDGRFGLKRAMGLSIHPIYQGMVLVLLLPWFLEAAGRARTAAGRTWWRLLPWLWGVALLLTLSRGPLLAALLTLASVAFFRVRRARLPLAILAVVLGVGAAAGKDAVIDALGSMAGEDEAAISFEINGEMEVYTGTRHRELQFKVYADAYARSGAFGLGTTLPGVTIPEELSHIFYSIDCHYLLFRLQYGYVGVAIFCLLAFASVASSFRAAMAGTGAASRLAGPLCGGLAATSLMMYTVWFAPDYAWLWLFSAGLAGNLRCLARESSLC